MTVVSRVSSLTVLLLEIKCKLTMTNHILNFVRIWIIVTAGLLQILPGITEVRGLPKRQFVVLIFWKWKLQKPMDRTKTLKAPINSDLSPHSPILAHSNEKTSYIHTIHCIYTICGGKQPLGLLHSLISKHLWDTFR